MYIPDEQWDELNVFCADLVEQLEAMPKDIFFACKKEAIKLCYIIINMQDINPINTFLSKRVDEITYTKSPKLNRKIGNALNGKTYGNDPLLTMMDVFRLGEYGLAKRRGIGPKSWRVIKDSFERHGLILK